MSRKIPSNHASRRNDDRPNDHPNSHPAADHPERARSTAQASRRAARAHAAPAAAPPVIPIVPSPEASGERLTVTPPPPLTASPLLLTPTEAATLLHVNRSTLYPLLMRGEIPSIRIGRTRRIPVSGLARWIDQQVSAQRADAEAGGAP